MAILHLRDRWRPSPEVISIPESVVFNTSQSLDVTYWLCKHTLEYDIKGKYTINKPRGWGKTILAASLVNNFDNVVLITNTIKEEIRVRRDYNVRSPNKYYIYGWDTNTKLVGLNYDWLVLDDVSDDHFEELKYYHGFGLKKYIRIGTFS